MNLTYFLKEFTYIFLLLEIKVSFLNQKNVSFPNLFRETELTKSLLYKVFCKENMGRNVRMKNFILKNETQ